EPDRNAMSLALGIASLDAGDRDRAKRLQKRLEAPDADAGQAGPYSLAIQAELARRLGALETARSRLRAAEDAFFQGDFEDRERPADALQRLVSEGHALGDTEIASRLNTRIRKRRPSEDEPELPVIRAMLLELTRPPAEARNAARQALKEISVENDPF